MAHDIEAASPSSSPVEDEYTNRPSKSEKRSMERAAKRLTDNGEKGRFARRFQRYILALGLEERGIRRVEIDERHDLKSYGNFQPALLWFSINLAATNITLGMLGPAVFGLGFTDASVCACMGMLVGCLPVAYIATFGPLSGNRALVFARYVMGWYPVKIIVVLNIVVLLGYSMINAVIAGQILSAVSPNDSLSHAVGIVISAIVTWLITTFGYKALQYYVRYAWIPQVIVLSILAGVSGTSFDLTTPTEGDAATRLASRISFFSVCLATAILYAAIAADYFVYYPATTSRSKIFYLTLLGLTTSFTYAFVLGIGLASAIPLNPSYATAYGKSQGALIVRGFSSLGAFGHFCAVVVALGLIVNMCPATYSSGIGFQILSRFSAKLPRIVWNSMGVVIYTVCALAGRDHLAVVFTNFLALMGYWASIWIAITLEEHLIFRRRSGFDWTAWNDPKRLPLGIAALVAFLVGWVGAVLGMEQVYFVGPVAKLVGESGADLGNFLGFGFAAVVFPPLRWLEIKRVGR